MFHPVDDLDVTAARGFGEYALDQLVEDDAVDIFALIVVGKARLDSD
jgi:hypothetical protein